VSGRIRTLRVAIGVALGITAMLAVPATAPANPVNDLLNEVTNTVNDTVGGLIGGGGAGGSEGGGSAADPQPRGGTPPSYVPPGHGDNPYAQGTGVVADLTPEDGEPLPYDPAGGSEDIIVGQSRGEQNPDGTYHGHVTPVAVALLGLELLAADTDPGETDDGPLGDVNALLGDVCSETGVCLTVLDMHSATTTTGTENSFSVATADINPGGALPVLELGAVESEGDIGDDGECQTAHSSSSVANADLLGSVNADVLDSSSTSTACNDGSSDVEQSSSAVNVASLELLELVGCQSGVPNSQAGIPLILEAVCGANDDSEAGGSQYSDPFGIRESIAVFPLTVLGNIIKASTAISETHAVAPGDDTEEPPGGPPSPNEGDNKGGTDAGGPGNEGKGGPGGPSADAPDEELPFTGADLLVLALIGIGVMGSGLAAMALADRRRRLARG